MKLVEDINRSLAEWNPLGVSVSISLSEYREYAIEVIEVLKAGKSLEQYLVKLLTEKMGLEYDDSNKEQVKDLQNIYIKLHYIFDRNCRKNDE